jgi:DNA-binding transcriptional regulator YhcF (GntR family)
MPRLRSSRIADIKAKLVARIRDGFHRPGDPFLSNRALADRCGVSYQTAHRLLAELVADGWLRRRRASGTFIAGRTERPIAVQLVFHPRAQRPGSFGASLLQRLVRALRAAGVPFVQTSGTQETRLQPHHLPVFWEVPRIVAAFGSERRFALLLHDAPPPGAGASYIDSVRTDDYSGAVCAAQVLVERLGRKARLAVLAGPADDRRSRQRIEGFRRLVPGAVVHEADGWFSEHGERAAADVLAGAPTGVFCGNDRLAEGLLAVCARRGIAPPAVIGYDNAPIAEALHLSTIAIPWEQLVAEAVKIVQARLAGDPTPARQIILSLRPHIRLTA